MTRTIELAARRTAWAAFAALLLLVSLTACSARSSTKGQITGADAPTGAVPDLAGAYSVNGFDPIGTEYGGNLIIKPGSVQGEYKLQWIITGSIQEGAGRIEGNTLRIDWRTVEGMRPAQGVTIYTITTKRELYGERRVEGYDKAGTEKAFPNPR